MCGLVWGHLSQSKWGRKLGKKCVQKSVYYSIFKKYNITFLMGICEIKWWHVYPSKYTTCEFSLLGAVKLATHYATAILLKSTLLTTYQVIPSWVHYLKEISTSNKSCFGYCDQVHTNVNLACWLNKGWHDQYLRMKCIFLLSAVNHYYY